MKIIGLTGPSGSGKGMCGDICKSAGIAVIDTDAVYHELLIPPSPCANELVSRFGTSIMREDGTVDREALSRIVFSDKSGTNHKDLNQITHKFVLCETLLLIERYQNRNLNAAVIDAPLLFEASFDRYCDFTIAVLADRSIRLSRILSRDGISEERANARLAAQPNDSFYQERANYILYNNTDTAMLKNRLIQILKKESVL